MKYAYHEPIGNPCRECGLTRSRHRVRHPPGCNCGASHKGGRSPSDKTRTRRLRKYIVGLDGEGIGREPHRYTLLAWSDATGRHTDSIENVSGLSSKDCLEFIIQTIPTDAAVYGYYLQYDWTMMLRDLPDASIYRLFRPALRRIPGDEGSGFTYVRWKGFRLHYLAGMMRIMKGKRCVTVWDVGRFFQAPFCNGEKRSALYAWNVGTKKERELIANMKERRNEFTRDDASQVSEYCLLECRKLAEVVAKLNDAHEQAGLPLKTWHGPGSTASAALRLMGIQDKRGKIPPAVEYAASCAFFGGRFEQSRLGYVKGPVYGYDIISAYPSQCVSLPCLEHARWERTTKEDTALRAEHAVVYYELASSRSKRAWGPLPVRLRNGNIVFPRTGSSGWIWLREFIAAKQWAQVRFKEAWTLVRECACKPFARVAEWFAERFRVGKNTGVGLTLKLCLNSIYGKLAQAVGEPKFRSQIWAGMITSGTRAQLLNPIAIADDAILAVATDGIYSEERLELDIGNQLGQWEEKEHDSILLVRPGIYWTDNDVRSRGLPRPSIKNAQNAIRDAINQGLVDVRLPDITQFGGATASISITRQGTFKRSHRYGQWHTRPARISLTANPKRDEGFNLWDLDNVESMAYDQAPLSPEAQKLKRQAQISWGNH